MRWANIATILVGAFLVVGMVAYNYHGVQEMSEQSQQVYLRLYGEGIYEYHALTGQWPTKTADLARTSLPLKYPHWWKAQLGIAADVIVIPKDLKPDPKDNGNLIVVYHNKGLDAELGRMWVCWGDLRTECITLEELQRNLNKLKKVDERVDAKLVGVWQNRSDAREFWTLRADGTVRWFYRGVPAIGIADSIVAYTYRADPSKSPAHLDMMHQGIMGTSYFIYEVTADALRIGNRSAGFGPKDMFYKRVPGEPTP